jgi:uncharacterized membrane protein
VKNRITAYWIVTVLFCLIFTFGGVANLVRVEFQREIMEALGYPIYLMTILGAAKVLGVIALLIPGQPILKEWAYAGFTFDMLGASASHAFAEDTLPSIVIPLAILALGAVSYLLRPDSRRITTGKTS